MTGGAGAFRGGKESPAVSCKVRQVTGKGTVLRGAEPRASGDNGLQSCRWAQRWARSRRVLRSRAGGTGGVRGRVSVRLPTSDCVRPLCARGFSHSPSRTCGDFGPRAGATEPEPNDSVLLPSSSGVSFLGSDVRAAHTPPSAAAMLLTRERGTRHCQTQTYALAADSEVGDPEGIHVDTEQKRSGGTLGVSTWVRVGARWLRGGSHGALAGRTDACARGWLRGTGAWRELNPPC